MHKVVRFRDSGGTTHLGKIVHCHKSRDVIVRTDDAIPAFYLLPSEGLVFQ